MSDTDFSADDITDPDFIPKGKKIKVLNSDDSHKTDGPSTSAEALQKMDKDEWGEESELARVCNSTCYLDGKFFKIDLQSRKRDTISAKCTTCGVMCKGKLGSSSNFVRHIKKEINSKVNHKKEPIQYPIRGRDTANALLRVTHIMTEVHVSLLTDNILLSQQDVPPEMARLIQINRKHQIMPILKTDFFNTRLRNFEQVTRNTTEYNLSYNFKPIGIGKLRLMLLVENAMEVMQNIGFTKKDIDDVKGILSDTNVYLLCITVFAVSVHILFDFLSFKNDFLFWRRKRSYEGLSTRTTLWRAFSQIVVFFYLLDENSSMLVLIPTALGALIELWKCKKILKLRIGAHGIQRKEKNGVYGNAEMETEEFDKQGMKYLSFLLYPLCLTGAVYSILYQPHKSWYSWTLNSLVNGVYAFGFLFMLPQLFVNYKLKSVAALPWRSFMYKAFNTFIDDFFAFVITMPTAHRVACLRDDVVFIIYLYQRWLYPVDQSRLDTGLAIAKNTSNEVVVPSGNGYNKKKQK